MKKDNIIRPHDRVKVIKPECFVRCGYPMDIEEEARKILDEHGEEIVALMKKVGIKETFGTMLNYHVLTKPNEQTSRSMMKVCRELAYAKCKTNNFGGKERRIYTETVPELADKTCRVLETKVVKTGVYQPGSVWHSYDYGVDDYDPAELCNQITHKLIRVYCSDTHFEKWIEVANVEKCL